MTDSKTACAGSARLIACNSLITNRTRRSGLGYRRVFTLALRWVVSLAIALPAWLLTPVAWADCPTGSACYTAREAQVCLVCLDEAEELRRLAREKEAERNAAVGALGECRLQRQALLLERDDWRDIAQRRPSWLWVVGVGVGALVVGLGVGVVGF